MIPASIQEEVELYIGNNPKPYLIQTFHGDKDCSCIYWDLPPLKEEDKPLYLRYQELTLQLIKLSQNEPNDPQKEILVKKANELLNGIPVTKRFGNNWISFQDLLKFDKTKGLRKEWWELHRRYVDSDLCIFQGYQSVEAQATRIADILIFMPEQDQYEFLRLNKTQGNNHPIGTERIINVLKKIDRENRVVIISALMDFVEFIFEKPVETRNISRIRQRLYRLCPSAEELTPSIRSGRVALWWD